MISTQIFTRQRQITAGERQQEKEGGRTKVERDGEIGRLREGERGRAHSVKPELNVN